MEFMNLKAYRKILIFLLRIFLFLYKIMSELKQQIVKNGTREEKL